jgi:transposase, IS30 family
MGKHYGQLSLKERVLIGHLHADGLSKTQIGRRLGRSSSTICRELERNSKATKTWSGGYDAARADGLADRRRRWDCRFKLARQPSLQKRVRERLAMGWSPAQIAGRLTQQQDSMTISHESIYRYIEHRVSQKDYSWHVLLPRQKYYRGRRPKKGVSDILCKRICGLVDLRHAHLHFTHYKTAIEPMADILPDGV